VLSRPVNRGGAGGRTSPWENVCPPWKNVLDKFEKCGHLSENSSPFVVAKAGYGPGFMHFFALFQTILFALAK